MLLIQDHLISKCKGGMGLDRAKNPKIHRFRVFYNFSFPLLHFPMRPESFDYFLLPRLGMEGRPRSTPRRGLENLLTLTLLCRQNLKGPFLPAKT